MSKNFSIDIESYFTRLKDTIDRISRVELQNFLDLLLGALERGGQVFIMGNGGSHATASLPTSTRGCRTEKPDGSGSFVWATTRRR